MLQFVEITGRVSEKGCIEIPVVLFEQTGIQTGEEVKLLYLAAGEADYRNEAREFMLVKPGEAPMEELLDDERADFRLPPQLLAEAKIPLDTDLEIVCVDRKIIIWPAEDVEAEEDIPGELLDICEELGISKEKVNIVLRAQEGEWDEEVGL